jgi:hypothetical protein
VVNRQTTESLNRYLHADIFNFQKFRLHWHLNWVHFSTRVLCFPSQELAWTSFALLKNVNCCSVLLLQPEAKSAVMARGAVAQCVAVQGNAAASLGKISQVSLPSCCSVPYVMCRRRTRHACACIARGALHNLPA